MSPSTLNMWQLTEGDGVRVRKVQMQMGPMMNNCADFKRHRKQPILMGTSLRRRSSWLIGMGFPRASESLINPGKA